MKRVSMLILGAAAAVSLNAQTWVASTGSDTQTCGDRTSPCATFAQAFAHAPVGGLIKALDAGNFGPVTITHSIILDGSGLAVSPGINVSASATDYVTIRSLTVFSSGTGISAVGSVQLYLYDIAIEGPINYGISLISAENTGTVTADNLRIIGAISNGLYNSGFTVTIKSSTFASNTIAIWTVGAVSPPISSTTTIEHCHIASSSSGGIAAVTGGTVRIDNTEIVDNHIGLVVFGGQIISYRTNTFANNVTDGTPSLSSSQK